MVRSHSTHSRAPHMTENEIALQWELKRVRAELAALRKAQEAGEKEAFKPDPLEGLPRAHLMMKVERICRRLVLENTAPEELCSQCGGVSFFQHENAVRAYAIRLGLDLDDASQTDWPYRRDETAESQQGLYSDDKVKSEVYAASDNKDRAHEDHDH